jgi:tripartite-type tricarboxylate transporter receptor subunit TctC
VIGVDVVAKAKPDGHTLLIANVGTQSINPTLYARLPYNPDTAFAPISLICELPFVLMASPKFAPNSVKELIALARAQPDKVTYASSGSGGSPHLTAELFQLLTGTKMTHVPYKGGGPAMTDLIGGQIDLMCDQTTNTTSQIEAKKVKAFAVTTPKRLSTPVLKDLPTLQESGLKNFEVTIWHGLYAPKGTPADVQKKLNDALKVALKDPDFIKKQEGLGAVVVTDKRSEPAEHKKFVQAEIAKWSPVIKAAGVYAD